jgi:guanylate kinase
MANLYRYPLANALVVRKTERTLRDSCFADLKWSINRLGVADDFKCNTSPLEITRKSTGQKILFRGCDDALKLTSITVPHGVLCWVWLEEAYELTKEKEFDTLNESIRGEMPDGYFKRFSVSFNPWNEHHWLKKRFFDPPDDDNKLSMTTDFRCNEWLDEADRRMFEDMIKNGDFLEWAIYNNNYYGTPLKPVCEKLEQGINVLLEIDVQGALDVKHNFPGGVYIFIAPPNIETLYERLKGRGTENPEEISRRVEAATLELSKKDEYDYIVINDQLETAVDEIKDIINRRSV